MECAAIKPGFISISRWLAKQHRDQGTLVNGVSTGGIIDQQPTGFLEHYRADRTKIGEVESGELLPPSCFCWLKAPELSTGTT